MQNRNWSRFLFRLWIIATIGWEGVVTFAAFGAGTLWSVAAFGVQEARVPQPRMAAVVAGIRACETGGVEFPGLAAERAEWDARIAAGATPTPLPDLRDGSVGQLLARAHAYSRPTDPMWRNLCEDYAREYSRVADELSGARRAVLAMAILPPVVVLALGAGMGWALRGLTQD